MRELARVCLACRTAYADDDACEVGDEHDVVELAAPDGRRRLVEAVWGDGEARRAARAQLARLHRRSQRVIGGATVVGLAAGLVVDATTLGVFGAAGGAVVGAVAARVSRPRAPMTHPIGAVPPAWPRVARRGRVTAGGALDAPASGEPCAAWAIELRYAGYWGERVTLRAAMCAGLEVTCEGGERLRVAPGPVVLVEPTHQVDEVASSRIAAVLHALDPTRATREPFPPLPYNIVGEALLFVGDRVEVLGVVEPRVRAGAAATSYRDAPKTELVPRGAAILRRI